MVTGESFITDEGRLKINESYTPFTVDMEPAAIVHVCHVNSIPFLSIRCIMDTAMHNGICNFEENCSEASAIAKNITLALLKEVSDSQNRPADIPGDICYEIYNISLF